jgi:hypothetical protein
VRKVCEFFGGSTYDTNTRSYRNPTVSGLGTVRRGFPREVDMNDAFIGQPPGTASGSHMIVQCPSGYEERRAMAGSTDGLKEFHALVQLHVFVVSTEPYVEDMQDYTYQLRDSIVQKIRTDRNMGTGGFEAGTGIGFIVGEGGQPWIRWNSSEPEVKENWVKQYLLIEFDAIMMIQA